MFERTGSSPGVGGYVVLAALAAAAGYFTAKYKYEQPDVRITHTEQGTQISYRGSNPRTVALRDNGALVVGTLNQRLDDLLVENPRDIRARLEQTLKK